MPKTVELDEGEYNRLQALHGVAVKIAGNPNSRKLFEQAHKLVVPDAATPLLDAEKNQLEPLNAVRAEMQARIDKLEKDREDERRETTLAALARRQSDGIAQLRRQGYTDEGVAAVQKLMEDKGLLEVEDAVAIFEKHNPPATVSTPGGGITGDRWNFTDTTADSDKSIVDLLASKGENQGVVDRMANSALMEIRGLRR